jgi:hypothetical protein
MHRYIQVHMLQKFDIGIYELSNGDSLAFAVLNRQQDVTQMTKQ